MGCFNWFVSRSRKVAPEDCDQSIVPADTKQVSTGSNTSVHQGRTAFEPLSKVFIFWDLDNIKIPKQLDAALGQIKNLHHNHLGLPKDVELTFEAVCNQNQYNRLNKKDLLTFERSGVRVTPTPNEKESADRRIERGINDAHVDYLRSKIQGVPPYNIMIGVMSNDQDFAEALRRPKLDGIMTVYISSDPGLKQKSNVQDCCTSIVDWDSLCPTSTGIVEPPDDRPASTQNAGKKQTVCCTVRDCGKEFKLSKCYKGQPENIKCPACQKKSLNNCSSS